MRRALRVAPRAQSDIDRILGESAERHSLRAANRYRRLIALAIKELRQEPERIGTKPSGLGDLRLYPLRFAAGRLVGQEMVRAPPHILVYRFDAEELEIVRLLHQAMDLPQHLHALTSTTGTRTERG